MSHESSFLVIPSVMDPEAKVIHFFFVTQKLFGLIPIQMDIRKSISRQHFPSLIYSIVVAVAVLVLYPMSRLYIFEQTVKHRPPGPVSATSIVGVTQGIISTITAVIILSQAIFLRDLMASYFTARFAIIGQLRDFPNRVAWTRWKWIFVGVMLKICLGSLCKVTTQFFIMRSLFKPEHRSPSVMAAIMATLLPMFIISLARNFFFEGVAFLYFLLAYTSNQLTTNVAKLKAVHSGRQSHEIWDLIDELSFIYGRIFALKDKFNRFVSFRILITIAQEIVDLTVQGYFQYQQYIVPWITGINSGYPGTSYYMSVQVVTEFVDFFISIYICQLLSKKVWAHSLWRKSLINPVSLQKQEITRTFLEIYELDLNATSRRYLDLFSLQVAQQPLTIRACGMFQVDLFIMTLVKVIFSNNGQTS